MAAKGSEMAIALVVVLMTWHGVLAQSGCSNALISLAPCLNFVTGNVTNPSSGCCSSLTGVVQTQPQCLCPMINGGGAMVGLGINQTLALSLPSACNVQTQPISRCNGASGPTSSAASPAGASGPTSSAVSPASAPVGSTSSDSPSYSSSDDTPVTTKTPSTPSQTNTPSTTGTGSKSTPSTTGASSGAITTSSQLPVVMLVSLTVSFALSATKF